MPKMEVVMDDFDKKAREKDAAAKQKMKEYADKRNQSKESVLCKNDWVLYRKPRGKVFNKHEPVRDPSPWKVIELKGSMVTAESSAGEQVTRNSSSFKKLNDDNQMVESHDAREQEQEETEANELVVVKLKS